MTEKQDGTVATPQLGFTQGLFSLLALIALVAGLYGAYAAWLVERVGETTTGRVVRSEKHVDPNFDPDDVGDGYLYAPVVEFSADGETITFESAYAVYPPAYGDGEQVRVRFDPINPQAAEIDNWTDRWVFPLVIIPLMLVSLFFLNFYKKPSR